MTSTVELTRSEWFAAADRMLDALAPFRLPSGAGIVLPGKPSWSGPSSDALEGFARSFLLVAFRIAGDGGADPRGLLTLYRAGLIAGTDPDHPDHWIPIVDRGQALVEAASVAIGLHLTREWLWDTLSPAEQQRAIAWLAPSGHVAPHDNNWVLFCVMIQEFLASVGHDANLDVISGGFARIDNWYEGGGWYRDGDGQNFDYYNAWAMHFYPLLWTHMAEARDPQFAATVRARSEDRLGAFLQSHVRFFGADGTPMFQGRSLSYRFAALAPLWLGEWHGVSPLTSGQTRRLTSRVLTRFVDGGAFDEQGVLTSGWLGDFPQMIQGYSGPASPYWASKGFVGLLLPADSPVWTAPAEPTPVEVSDAQLTLAGPGWLLSSTAADGIVRLVNHGSDHHPLERSDAPLYDRFGYSTATAPSWDASPIDQHVSIVDDDGRVSQRCVIERVDTAVADSLASAHDAVFIDNENADPVPAGRILSASIVNGASAIHLHRIHTTPGRTIRVGGWAVADPHSADVLGDSIAAVQGGGVRTILADLLGETTASVHRTRGTSPCGDAVAVPVLQRTAAERTVVLAWTYLAGADIAVPTLPQVESITDDEHGTHVIVQFDDGTRRELRLPA